MDIFEKISTTEYGDVVSLVADDKAAGDFINGLSSVDLNQLHTLAIQVSPNDMAYLPKRLGKMLYSISDDPDRIARLGFEPAEVYKLGYNLYQFFAERSDAVDFGTRQLYYHAGSFAGKVANSMQPGDSEVTKYLELSEAAFASYRLMSIEQSDYQAAIAGDIEQIRIYIKNLDQNLTEEVSGKLVETFKKLNEDTRYFFNNSNYRKRKKTLNDIKMLGNYLRGKLLVKQILQELADSKASGTEGYLDYLALVMLYDTLAASSDDTKSYNASIMEFFGPNYATDDEE